MISEAIKICIAEREKIIEMIAGRVVARKNANGDMQKSTFLVELKELKDKADVYEQVLTTFVVNYHKPTAGPEQEQTSPKRRVTRRAKADE